MVKRFYQLASTLKHTTWYARDAQGNILSIYERPHADSAIKQTEVHIYGSSRIGIEQRNITYSTSPFAWLESEQHRHAGTKRYELTDHLGNVRVTISDLLVPRPASSFGYATQDAEVIDRRDYYPFGMEMPGRRWRAATEGAGRFGFFGGENDNEIAGEGNTVTTYHRLYDTRIARWMSVDPESSVFPSRSPYLYASDNPISRVDPFGDTDFWSQAGQLVGTDGENNGRNLILVSEVDVNKALDNHFGTGVGGFFNRLFGNGNQAVTRISEFSGSTVEVPSLEVRQAILAAVERSNGTTADDKTGGFHEEGGYWGEKRVTGELVVVDAKPGAYSDPRVNKQANVDLFDAADHDLGLSVEVALGEFHIHPKGELSDGVNSYFFKQFPSPGDVDRLDRRSSNLPQGYLGIVVGARDSKVYFYGPSSRNTASNNSKATLPVKALTRMNQRDVEREKQAAPSNKKNE